MLLRDPISAIRGTDIENPGLGKDGLIPIIGLATPRGFMESRENECASKCHHVFFSYCNTVLIFRMVNIFITLTKHNGFEEKNNSRKIFLF